MTSIYWIYTYSISYCSSRYMLLLITFAHFVFSLLPKSSDMHSYFMHKITTKTWYHYFFSTPHPTTIIPSSDLRRHPRSILRPSRTLQSRRWMPWQKLPLPRRLCRSWVLQCRNIFTIIGTKSPISRSDYIDSRQSWKSTDYTSLWILRWMLEKVWECQCMEVLHGNFRLFVTKCHYWR